MAWDALQRIGTLYAIEAKGKDLSIDARQQLRREKSLPQLQVFHDWLMQTRAVTANGGASAKALDYTLKRWPTLIRYARGTCRSVESRCSAVVLDLTYLFPLLSFSGASLVKS
jgi:hypothetical protein